MVDLLAGLEPFIDLIQNRPLKRRRLSEIEDENLIDEDDDIRQVNNHNNDDWRNRINPLIQYASIDLTSPSSAAETNSNAHSISNSNQNNNHGNVQNGIVDLTEEVSDNDTNPNDNRQNEQIDQIDQKEQKEQQNEGVIDEIPLFELSDSDEIQILNQNSNLNNDANKNKTDDNEQDADVMITKIKKSKQCEQREKRDRRLKKIEQWLQEDDDEYFTNGVRKLLLLCPICQESLIDNNATSTECGHLFCGSCLLSSLNRVSQCPLCQKPMNIMHTHKVYL